MSKLTFAVIVGNRGFFPDQLAKDGRKTILDVIKKNNYNVVAPSLKDMKFGAVETFQDAKKCADIFKQKSDQIDGIIVTLPNFGDEKGILETIKRSQLDVPILIHAESDDPSKMKIQNRRDSFCGKISVCSNLRQAGIPFTLTSTHTVKASSAQFSNELSDFASICRIIKGLKNVRFGAIGARPAAFNTVRYSEKLLERYGIAVEPIDLSEILGKVKKLSDSDKGPKNKLNKIKSYVQTTDIPEDVLKKMAKFGFVIDEWINENDLAGTTIQCWTSLEEFFGIVPCTLMSMMSEALLPSACEVDMGGLIAMYILGLASQTPSALLDWNNNYGSGENKCVLFHCSNLPKSFFKGSKMDYQQIIAGSVGKENTYGTIVGKIAPAKATFMRISTDDTEGMITGYAGQGEFTNDKIQSFGGYGVMKIPNLQLLMKVICKGGFEHHVAVNKSSKAEAVTEALTTYMGWDIYRHI